MADPTPTLADLIATITADRRIATEVLQKLPQLINTSGDVTFQLASPVVVPSIPKIQAQALGAGVGDRVTTLESLTRGLVQEIDRFASFLGTQARRTNPYWFSLDLRRPTGGSADSSNAFFRSEVNDGIRLPFDGYTVQPIDRQFTSSAPKIGDWLLPPYTVISDQRFGSFPSGSQYVNAFAYVIAGPNRTATKVINTPVYAQYYGYYYYQYNYTNTNTNTVVTNTTDTVTTNNSYYIWYKRYYGSGTDSTTTTNSGSSTATSVDVDSGQSSTSNTVQYTYILGYNTDYYDYLVPTYVSLSGSLIAQSFQPSIDMVVPSFQLAASYVADLKAAAAPKLYLVENSYGRPNMDQIITTGVLRNDSEAAKSGVTNANLTFDLARPVVLTARRSYSVVIETSAEFRLLYTTQSDTTGGLFYTQDRKAWEQDIVKDLALTINYCDFGTTDTTIYIATPPIQLSGGIASAKQNMAVENGKGATATMQVNVNGAWYDLSYLNTVTSLPPYTQTRLKLVGTRFSFPVINTTQSTVTAFRPATSGRFISVAMSAKQKVTVSYELLGYDATFHTFDPGLVVGSTRYTPTSTAFAASSDGMVRNLTCVYQLPVSTQYKHDIRQTTLNASSTFDIRSVIELNA